MDPIRVEWKQRMAFTGHSSEGHEVGMDASAASGGDGQAPRPTELVLMGLGGCTGMDVVSILAKMQQPLRSLEIAVEADRADEHPKVFTAIRLLYRVAGEGLELEKVRRAIDLSLDKYCTVGNVLNKTAAITYEIELNGERMA
ncbi:MAG: OsmC family protein [Chitinophagales bacterium]